MLANAIAEALPYKPEYVYGVECSPGRGDSKSGISAIRGGTIGGELEFSSAGRTRLLNLH
jgi:hypothetical protein